MLKMNKSSQLNMLEPRSLSTVNSDADLAVGSISSEPCQTCPTIAASGALSCTGSDVPPVASVHADNINPSNPAASSTQSGINNAYESDTELQPTESSSPEPHKFFESPFETTTIAHDHLLLRSKSAASSSSLALPPFEHPYVKWIWDTRKSVTESEVHKIYVMFFKLTVGQLDILSVL